MMKRNNMKILLFVARNIFREPEAIQRVLIPFLIILLNFLLLTQQNIHAKEPKQNIIRTNSTIFTKTYASSSHLLEVSDTIWYEDFDNLSDGITMHAGEAGWNRDLQNVSISGHFEVVDHKYEAHYVNSEVLWVSEYINIKYYNNVGIHIDLACKGELESSDSVNVYYRIDDGPAFPLQNAQHFGNFESTTATASGLSGSWVKRCFFCLRYLNNFSKHF